MIDARGWAALALFVSAYALFAVREHWRVPVGAVAAAIALGSGLVPLSSLRPTSFSGQGGVVEWNSIGLLVGLFLFAGLLHELGVFRYAALRIAGRFESRPIRLYVVLTVLAFGLSAVVNSISVVLVLAPLTLEVARALGRNPIPYVIAEISASNAGGAATFVGDLPNVILGTYFQLGFVDFLEFTSLPAIAALAVILLWFRRGLGDAPEIAHPPPLDPPRSAIREPNRAVGSVVVFGGVLVVLSAQAPLGIPVWLVGVAGGILALALAGPRLVKAVLARFDWQTVAFFLCLFILVGALVATGDIDALAQQIGGWGGGNLLLTGTILLWTLGLLSTVVNNIPLAAAAAPLIAALSGNTGMAARPLVWAAAIGSDIGGNGTPIGASANIVGLAAASKAGTPITWSRYVRTAFPAMLLSLAAANLVWLFVH
ncbi:MAG: hypothetical protein L3K19_00380 [Thermoplasmata archaeon]|nr:hypothetical protein [Thermoplasmata archaeon]